MPTARRNVVLLVVFCLMAYCVGLTSHGLTNWQEAQRALVAREMQANGRWLIPSAEGHPYLAKPPLIYWCQLTIAKLLGRTTGIFELRLTVALAGLAGVVSTYVVARRMLASEGDDHERQRQRWADNAAVWGAMCLATGILYFRSSRIGELDILLAPCVVVTVGAVHAAYHSHRARGRTRFGAVLLAIIAATLAVLAKGPPALLVPLVGAFGGIAIWELFFEKSKTWPARAKSLFFAYSRTHPVAVLGVPLLVMYLWWRHVSSALGPDVMKKAAAAETSDNLRLLEPEAILRNLEAASYGVGLGSVCAVIAGVWLIKDRPRLRPAWVFIIAWVVLSLIAFSTLGKGVARYMTPVWPGIALLGGMWIASALRDFSHPERLRTVLAGVIVALGLGQTWWYGFGREHFYWDRSPQRFIAELTGPDIGADPARIVTLGFADPGIDYYAGRALEGFLTDQPPSMQIWEKERPLAEFAGELRDSAGSAVLLTEATLDGQALDRWKAELDRAGLTFEPITTKARYTTDNRRVRIIAGTVRAAPR